MIGTKSTNFLVARVGGALTSRIRRGLGLELGVCWKSLSLGPDPGHVLPSRRGRVHS